MNRVNYRFRGKNEPVYAARRDVVFFSVARFTAYRDGEEWLKHRKLLNDVLLKRDYYAEAEENAVFVDDVFERWLQRSNDGQIVDLENELYNLSMICKLISYCVLVLAIP